MDEKNVLEKRNKIMENSQLKSDYLKVRDVIVSCNNEDQLRVGVKMYNLLLRKYDELTEKNRNILEQLIGLMRLKCKSKPIKEISSVGKEFKRQAGVSGTKELKELIFDEEEQKGGKSDNMSPEDLAKKHNVDIETIKKEIHIGTQIEKEHTDNDDIAKEIAMDHIVEIDDYYTDPDYGIIAIEKKQGGEKDKGNGGKTIRISKSDMEKLHKDGKTEVDGYSLSYSEDMDEATSAGSSGSYVTAMDRQPITRTFKKGEIPVSIGGMDKPIGKMFSYNPKPGVLEEDDIEEAVSYAGAVGAYDTPGFAPSEFMGTKGKKGKAPVNKGITHKKTAYPGGKFVKIKDRCSKFPYCNQSPEAITLYSENKIIKKSNLKIKK